MNLQQSAEAALKVRDDIAIDCGRAPKQLATNSLTDESSIRAIGKMLPTCPIVIWQYEMFELATNGYESFVGLQNSSIWHPLAPEFWYFESFSLDVRALKGVLGESVSEGYECHGGIFIPATHTRDGVAVFVLLMLPNTTGRFYFRLMNMEAVFTASTAQMIAAYAFTQQRIAAKERIALPRSERRRIAKAKKPEPEIRIVHLRQREAGNGESGTREYHHKWIVRGHWRRLHEPRKSDGAEITFVHAHVKGPHDAPLLSPKESIFVVAR
jgi:hypothetical protein